MFAALLAGGHLYGAAENVGVAVNTLTPGGNVTVAVAVDDASVPVSAVLFTVTRFGKPSVTALTAITVPRGTFVAVRFTTIGFEVVGARVVSGTARNAACGFGGTGAPPMAVIRTVGKPAPGTTGI